MFKRFFTNTYHNLCWLSYDHFNYHDNIPDGNIVSIWYDHLKTLCGTIYDHNWSWPSSKSPCPSNHLKTLSGPIYARFLVFHPKAEKGEPDHLPRESLRWGYCYCFVLLLPMLLSFCLAIVIDFLSCYDWCCKRCKERTLKSTPPGSAKVGVVGVNNVCIKKCNKFLEPKNESFSALADTVCPYFCWQDLQLKPFFSSSNFPSATQWEGAAKDIKGGPSFTPSTIVSQQIAP